jgi:hypothetical protein
VTKDLAKNTYLNGKEILCRILEENIELREKTDLQTLKHLDMVSESPKLSSPSPNRAKPEKKFGLSGQLKIHKFILV